MADKIVKVWSRDHDNGEVQVKYVDLLDGSFALAVVNKETDAPIALAASELHLGEVGGRTTTSIVEFTRENNATPYSIGDVISSSASIPLVFELPNLMRINGGTGILINTRVIFNVKSVTPLLCLNFFNASNPTISGDNLPHQEKYADISKRLGYVELPAMKTATDSTNSDMSRTMMTGSTSIPLKAASNTKSIWVSLQTLSVLTLTALSKVTIIATVLND